MNFRNITDYIIRYFQGISSDHINQAFNMSDQKQDELWKEGSEDNGCENPIRWASPDNGLAQIVWIEIFSLLEKSKFVNYDNNSDMLPCLNNDMIHDDDDYDDWKVTLRFAHRLSATCKTLRQLYSNIRQKYYLMFRTMLDSNSTPVNVWIITRPSFTIDLYKPIESCMRFMDDSTYQSVSREIKRIRFEYFCETWESTTFMEKNKTKFRNVSNGPLALRYVIPIPKKIISFNDLSDDYSLSSNSSSVISKRHDRNNYDTTEETLFMFEMTQIKKGKRKKKPFALAKPIDPDKIKKSFSIAYKGKEKE